MGHRIGYDKCSIWSCQDSNHFDKKMLGYQRGYRYMNPLTSD
jgi:hypothetical protein